MGVPWWLGLQDPNAGCPGPIPGQGTRYHMLQLKIPHAATKTCKSLSRVLLYATPETAAHRAPRPWDSPGKNTGLSCHFLLQCMKVKSGSEVAQPRAAK